MEDKFKNAKFGNMFKTKTQDIVFIGETRTDCNGLEYLFTNKDFEEIWLLPNGRFYKDDTVCEEYDVIF